MFCEKQLSSQKSGPSRQFLWRASFQTLHPFISQTFTMQILNEIRTHSLCVSFSMLELIFPGLLVLGLCLYWYFCSSILNLYSSSVFLLASNWLVAVYPLLVWLPQTSDSLQVIDQRKSLPPQNKMKLLTRLFLPPILHIHGFD